MKEQEMNETVKHEKTFDAPQGDSEVMVLLKKIQQHLVYLEKKIDALGGANGQSSDRPRPSFQRNRFGSSSRPPRPFNSHRPEGGRREHHSGERDFSSGQGRPQGQARPFDRPRPSGGDRDFGVKKKRFFHRDR